MERVLLMNAGGVETNVYDELGRDYTAASMRRGAAPRVVYLFAGVLAHLFTFGMYPLDSHCFVVVVVNCDDAANVRFMTRNDVWL